VARARRFALMKKIMVIDDDAPFRTAAVATLRRPGCKVHVGIALPNKQKRQ
jgi:hypothetical protein